MRSASIDKMEKGLMRPKTFGTLLKAKLLDLDGPHRTISIAL